MIRDIDGRVPWSVIIYYADGRCGRVGCCSASDTPEKALADAKEWCSKHSESRDWWFLNPSCEIHIGYRNIIDGSRPRP